jgi:hypothetical protein
MVNVRETGRDCEPAVDHCGCDGVIIVGAVNRYGVLQLPNKLVELSLMLEELALISRILVPRSSTAATRFGSRSVSIFIGLSHFWDGMVARQGCYPSRKWGHRTIGFPNRQSIGIWVGGCARYHPENNQIPCILYCREGLFSGLFGQFHPIWYLDCFEV